MKKAARLLIAFLVSTQIVHAEIPAELEGTWVVDIPATIEKMLAAGMLKADSASYMKEKLLPNYQTTIHSDKMINKRASGEASANIDFKEMQGANTVVNLTGEAGGKKTAFLMTFVPQTDGTLLMETENKADQSGLIIWKKQ